MEYGISKYFDKEEMKKPQTTWFATNSYTKKENTSELLLPVPPPRTPPPRGPCGDKPDPAPGDRGHIRHSLPAPR